MKKLNILSILLITMLFACKGIDNTDQLKNEAIAMTEKEMTYCNEGGTCETEIKEDTTYTLEGDTIGQQYPKYSESEKHHSFLFRYRQKREKIPDNAYIESVVLNLPKGIKNKTFTDSELDTFGALFSIVVFNRDIAGNFPIKKGTLHIIDSDKLQFEFLFDVPERNNIVNYIQN